MRNNPINYDNAKRIAVKAWDGRNRVYYAEKVRDNAYEVSDGKSFYIGQVACMDLGMLKSALSAYEEHQGRISLQGCINRELVKSINQ